MDTNEKALTEDLAGMISTIEASRERLHKIVDRKMDELIQQVHGGQFLSQLPHTQPLSLGGYPLKGNKPLSVLFPDGHEIKTRTWKEVAAAILKDCNSDPVMHEHLMKLRGKVQGRDRVILGATPDMDVPICIDDELYMEGKYDTETLFYVLTERVLKPVGYNCHRVSIQYLTLQQIWNTPAEEQQEDAAMTMEQTL